MKRPILVSFLLCMATVIATKIQAEAPSAMPYYFQYDNLHEGERACSITSMAMVLDYFAITPPAKETGFAKTPNYLYDRFGIRQQPEDLAAIFNILAREHGANVRNVFYERGTIAQLRAHLEQGLPAIVHGWFTGSGHIVVVTDYDGTHYTVNDPAGRWNLQKFQAGQYDTSQSGKQIKYPAGAFEYAINDNGTGNDLWLHLFKPTEQ